MKSGMQLRGYGLAASVLLLSMAAEGLAATKTGAPNAEPTSRASALLAHTSSATARTRRATRVEAHPERIVIERRSEYAQLLLTAFDADGYSFDATRLAQVVAGNEHLQVDERGLVRPLADGEGSLTFTIDELEIRLPYTVQGMQDVSTPGFRRDVMPVISAAGCNTGSCHGAQDGKQGFKLSLRGYDPGYDHAALTDDLFSRRFDRVRPERSLFLAKPTAAVPHAGGQVLLPGSSDYEVLRAWAEGGAKYDESSARVVSLEVLPSDATIQTIGDSQQFAVLANYSDGRRQDVTAHAFVETNDTEVTAVDERGLVSGLRRGEAAILARFEGQYAATRLYVRGDREGWEWEQPSPHNYIDTYIYDKLREVESAASELCTDAEFLRRVSLDLTGRLPGVRQTRQFLMDTRSSRQKRDELTNRLIGSSDFIDYWTNKWCDLLQVNQDFLGKEGAHSFRQWIEAAVASNRPYDEFVRSLLDTSGKVSETPAASYYKILREPDLVMENSTQLFLGIRFNCNKCHDHPFERWTQKDHWQLASYFAQVDRTNVEGTAMMSGGITTDEVIGDKTEGEVTYPESTRVAPASFPYQHTGAKAESNTRRAQLASWMTARENPYFARSMANRLWSYFMGRGLIEPVDDIRAGNPATHPELLDHLTEDFLEAEFDVRAMMRLICQSRTYQHSVSTTRWNKGDDVNYGHALARRLPAEVLFDAVHTATGTRSSLPGVRRGTRAVQLVDASVKSQDGFLDLFGRPARESSCECERGTGLSLGQALNLINGPTLADALSDAEGGLSELLQVENDPDAIIEELYLAFLCRYPSTAELETLRESLDARLPANRDALSPEQVTGLNTRYDKWQTEKSPIRDWETLFPVSAVSAAKTQIVVEEDGSLRIEGEIVERDTYTIVAAADGGAITGIRVEVLADEALPGGGPGRSENGNFVLNELSVQFIPVGKPTAARQVVLQNATADLSQAGWAVSGAIDGKPDSGWAVSPDFGKDHVAIFECKEDIGDTSGALLVFNLEQQHGSKHTIGRLRISVTREARPIRHHGLSPEVAEALMTSAEQRSDDQEAAVYSHFIASQPDLEKSLLLATTQDLAWALANSPAFLFNR
ncbi:MAG: hypothetical protein ACI841_001669 [Planctomycetota bacterium]|jgi:hypothetical protein